MARRSLRRITQRVMSGLADARDAASTRAAAQRTPTVPLDSVRRRIELLLAGLYARPLSVDQMLAPRRTNWSDLLKNPVPRHARTGNALAMTDGNKVLLPREIADAGGEERARQRYRLLAIEQAERIVRGTSQVASAISDLLVRDLFLLAEGSAIDASITRSVRNGAMQLRLERDRALAERPRARGMSAVEYEVERLAHAVLSAAADAELPELRRGSQPADSLAWAVARARDIVGRHAEPRYRGVALARYWGAVTATEGAPRIVTDNDPTGVQSRGTLTLPTDGARAAGQSEDADARGLSANESKAQGEQIPDEHGTDGDGDDGSTAGASAQESEAQGLGPPMHDESATKAAVVIDLATGVLYDEWDTDRREYRTKAVRVRLMDADVAEQDWAGHALEMHASIVRSIRRRFERLRAQRARLHAQRQGDELDLMACVEALVDRQTGHSASDRLYLDVRPARRGMAISVLADVSGSTNASVTPTDRIIDFEKLAMLLASEAFDALGDPYSLMTFSSQGADDVQIRTVKSFGERNGRAVRERITAMRAKGNTRLGAAIRHATAQLTRQPGGHRLLVVLSDGKPSDVGRYMGAYAVEDSRQAIAEARAAGVFPFCITVDSVEPEYVAHMFGPAGYVRLVHAEQLPVALLKAVRQLIGAS